MTVSPEPTVTLAEDDVVGAAFALLMAAITFRDLVSAMSPTVVAAMPPDLLDRVNYSCYQEEFDRFPGHIRAKAIAVVDADAAIIAARALDRRRPTT